MEIDKEAAKKYLALDKRQAKQKKQEHEQEVAMDEDEVVQAAVAGQTAEEINIKKRKMQ